MLDACSQQVIGYAASTRLDTELTLEALRMAIAVRKPGPGIIHHSKTLRYEELYLCEYETMENVMTRLPYFIEEYNSLTSLYGHSRITV